MSGNIGQANTFTSDRASIGQLWEFIDLAQLVPPQSVHDQTIDTQARFALFDVICPKRKQSITERTKAYTVYIAALLQKFMEQASAPTSLQ